MVFSITSFWYDSKVKPTLPPKVSTQQQEKKSSHTFRRGMFFLGLILLLVGFWYLMNQPFWMVREVTVSGERTIPRKEIISATEEYLADSWLGVIPRRNFLFIGSSQLEEFLKTKYSKIYDVDTVVDQNKLSLKIEERSIHSLWCVLREYENPFDEECYFADQRGLWYVQSPYFSDNVFRKVYLDPSVDSIVVGEYFGEEDVITEFFPFVEQLEQDYELEVGAIYLLGQDDVVLGIERLRNERFARQPRIIFNRKDSFERISRDIGITLEEKDFNQQWSETPSLLQTIDVRFEGRIFYRFGESAEYTHYQPLGDRNDLLMPEDTEAETTKDSDQKQEEIPQETALGEPLQDTTE